MVASGMAVFVTSSMDDSLADSGICRQHESHPVVWTAVDPTAWLPACGIGGSIDSGMDGSMDSSMAVVMAISAWTTEWLTIWTTTRLVVLTGPVR